MTQHMDTLRFERLFFTPEQDHVFFDGIDGTQRTRIAISDLAGLEDFVGDIRQIADALDMTPSSPRLWKMASRESERPGRNLMVQILVTKNLTPWFEVRNLPLDYPMDDPEAQETYDLVEAVLLRRTAWASTIH